MADFQTFHSMDLATRAFVFFPTKTSTYNFAINIVQSFVTIQSPRSN